MKERWQEGLGFSKPKDNFLNHLRLLIAMKYIVQFKVNAKALERRYEAVLELCLPRVMEGGG